MEIVEIIAKRLRQAREELGWKQEESARRLGIAREYLSRLERGRQAVPMRLLRRVADLYGYPLNWFYGLSEPTGTLKLFLRASQASSFSQETRQALRKFADLCGEIAHLRKLLNESVPPLPSYPANRNERDKRSVDRYALRIAKLARIDLGLEGTSAWRLPEALERLGVAILRLPLESGLSGAMAYDVEQGAFILVNSKDHPTRQLWTIAHECGHLLTERERGYQLPEVVNVAYKDTPNDVREYFANRFAAHLLMPEEQVRTQLAGMSLDLECIIEVRRAFGVSYPALLYRLHELGYLTKAQMEHYRERNLSMLESVLYGEPPDLCSSSAVPSQTLRRLAIQAAKQGVITLSYAGDLLEISPMEVQDILDAMETVEDGGVPSRGRRRYRDAV